MLENRCGDTIGKYISQIYRKGGIYISKALAKEGIGSGQLMFLMQLYINDGLIQEDISSSLNIDKATTARALKKLEEENFIIRTVDERDKRALRVYLTDKGRNARPKIYEVFGEWERLMTESLSEEDKDNLIKLLRKISTNISGKGEAYGKQGRHIR